MSTIGHRITPNDAASLRHRTRTERLPRDTMDNMAAGLGWTVDKGLDDRGYPYSEYQRGPWVLLVGWSERGGHGIRADLNNTVTREHAHPDRSKWKVRDHIDPVKRSQDIFRWVGHHLYNEELR